MDVDKHLARVADSRRQLDHDAAMRAERLAQRVIAARSALLMGGQTAEIRCKAALRALDGDGGAAEVVEFADVSPVSP